MLTIRGLRHEYAGRVALAIDALDVAEGAHRLLLGPSGSGKSTLLHVIAGLLRPTAGTVVVAGQDLGALSGAALDRFRGRSIGIVLQRLHLIASLTVLENVLLAQYGAGLRQDRQKAHETLDALGLLAKAGAYPHELSHGQAQRTAIARAVVNRPRLLLADEPTSALDDDNATQALDLLTSRARACGATLVIATHDARVRDRIPDTHDLRPTGVHA
jgi:putative ABC transport system ATP-binding protein